MTSEAFTRIEAALRTSWSAETCDPADVVDWSPQRPDRGQCGVTALVLNDLLGGHLMIADAIRADGSRQGVHYWNVLADGSEVDLTRGQFSADEVVQLGAPVERPPGPPGRCREQYLLLSERVAHALAPRAVSAASPPGSAVRPARHFPTPRT
ncbi:MAG: hypothetical protein WCB04_01110 [Mycobacteriales bacterium]